MHPAAAHLYFGFRSSISRMNAFFGITSTKKTAEFYIFGNINTLTDTNGYIGINKLWPSVLTELEATKL